MIEPNAQSPTRRSLRGTIVIALAVSLLMACSASTQKPAVDAALDDPKLRHESLEATLRVLDEHPEYVDELFVLTLRHPKTLDRFLQNTAVGLRDEKLARMAARRLAEQPEGLRLIMIANLDAVSDKPPSLRAISEAIDARPQVAAIAIVQKPETVRSNLRALLQEVSKNPEARRAFLLAVQENSALMAEIVAPNPETLGALMRGFAAVGVQAGKEELQALVKALAPSKD